MFPFREKLTGKYSAMFPAANAFWGLCCCTTPAAFRYLYAAGRLAPNMLDTASIYTGSTDSTAATSTLPSPARYSLMGTGNAAGDVYVTFGNTTVAVSSGLVDHDKYAFTGASWTSKTDAPSPGRGFIIGGMRYTPSQYLFSAYGIDTSNTNITQCDRYYESGDTWASSTAAPGTGRQTNNCNTLGNYGYSLGGRNSSLITNISLSENNQLDLAAETWTTKTSMSQARDGCGSFSFGSKLYGLAGEFQNFPNPTSQLKSIEEYDPNTNSWTNRTSLVSGNSTNSQGASDEGNQAGYYATNGATTHQEYVVDFWTTKNTTDNRSSAATGAAA